MANKGPNSNDQLGFGPWDFVGHWSLGIHERLVMSNIIPIPRVSVNVRPATIEDLPFIDSLQKAHTKQVGWMPTAQLEGKIKAGHALVAEEMRNSECGMRNEENASASAS